MPNTGTPKLYSAEAIVADLRSGLVVFLVALPLCLGIALASGTSAMSGLLAGIIGGLIVGAMSGSHTSVSGPAAGLTAIVLARMQVHEGSFETFILAVFLAGVIQIGMGLMKAGALSAFFPSSVIKGLLAAIGVILILKQLPHLVGHDDDFEGEMSFQQPDGETTFSELLTVFPSNWNIGAAVIGLSTILLLLIWNRVPRLRSSLVPGPLVVVLAGVALNLFFSRFAGGVWGLGADQLVTVFGDSEGGFLSGFVTPKWSAITDLAVAQTAIQIALVASLETLLNLEAVDKLDKLRRQSPGSRELVAQGVGNMCGGLIGALPVTSVIVRSSVNVNAGSKTKMSAFYHGVLLLVFVALLPQYLELIPKAALAAILIVTGFRLASWTLFRSMWKEGPYQFLPFIITLVSIQFSDLLIGILIGLCVSALFILNSNLRRPIRRIIEPHLDGDIIHVELANQVSFLNRAALDRLLHEAKPGSRLLIDASESDYIDPDILSLIRDFHAVDGPTRGVKVQLKGFRSKYQTLFAEAEAKDPATPNERSTAVDPVQIVGILREGNRRFFSGERLKRDLLGSMRAQRGGIEPLAVVLSCIDAPAPPEMLFDTGIGDLVSVRVAGHELGSQSLASLEYSVKVSGAKLVMVLGHTLCESNVSDSESKSLTSDDQVDIDVETTLQRLFDESDLIRQMAKDGRIKVVGAVYSSETGRVKFLEQAGTVATG